MKAVLIMTALAANAATITSTWNYQAAMPSDGYLNMQILAPRFDASLGTLSSFRLEGMVGIDADATIGTANTVGDLDAVFDMAIKLKWADNPVYSQKVINGAPLHASVAPQTEHLFSDAIVGSATLATGCTSCAALPPSCDYRFSLRFTTYRQVNLPYTTYSLDGTVTADFTAFYEYEPMIHNPEPASWALMAGGIGGLAYFRKRHHGPREEARWPKGAFIQRTNTGKRAQQQQVREFQISA